MATPKTTGSLTVKSTSTVDAPLDYSTDFTTKFTYTESTSAGANAFMIHSDTTAVALSLKGTSDDILIIDGYSGDYTAKLSGSKLTLENSHQRITVALAAKSVVTLKFLDGNKEVNLQEKTLGGESLITKTGVLHINGMNAHELTSVTAAVTAALTDVNRKTYTTVDAAIISDNAIVASKALTDKLGKSYATVDAAIISDNVFVISNALIDKSGKSYLTVDVAITEAKTQALAPYTSLDQAIQSNDNAMIAKALTDSGTGFTTIAELAAAYKLLTPPIIPTFKVESLNAAMAPTITAAVNEGQKANFKISLQGNRGTNDYSVKTLLVGTSGGATNDDFASTLTLDSLSSAAGITFNSTTGELKIPAQVTIPSAILTATVNNDNVSPESGEKLNLTLSDPQGTNATLLSTATTASFAITDTTSTFNVNSVTPTVLEGATASFVVNLLKGASATGDYSVKTTLAGTGLTDTSKATANVDFANTLTLDTASLAAGIRFDSTTGVLSIPATATVTKATLTTTVATDNVYPETSEGLSLTLSAVSGVNVALGTSVANTTITETPPAPTFSVSGSAAALENTKATFVVNLANRGTGEYSVKTALSAIGGATLGTDFKNTLTLETAGVTFDPTSGLLTIPAGINVPNITLTSTISSDLLSPETGEGLSLTLSEPKGTNAALGTTTANTLITDVTPPTFTVTAPNATVNEGANASFIVNLANRVAGEAYSVPLTLAGIGPTGGLATVVTDYDALTAFTLDATSIAAGITLSAAGVLAIPAASTVTSVTLTGAVKSDLITPEIGEGLKLTLTETTNATLSAIPYSTITILDTTSTTLTLGLDSITGGNGDSTYTATGFTLNSIDNINDDTVSTGNDVINITTDRDIPAATISGVETVNLTALNNITVNMKPAIGGFSGVKAFNIKDSTAPVIINNIPDPKMAIGLIGSNVNTVIATYQTNATPAASVTTTNNDKLFINLNTASNADITVNAPFYLNTDAAKFASFETAEINVLGQSTINNYQLIITGTNTYLPTLTISGTGALTIGKNALKGVTDILITNTGSITLGEIGKIGEVGTTQLKNLNASAAGAITADKITGANTGINAIFSPYSDIVNITSAATSGSNTVKLGGGSDILNMTSVNTADNYLFGEDGNDIIIVTGAGTSYIDGGLGDDTITGGQGVTNFNVSAGTDTITDLGYGIDSIATSLGATANANLYSTSTSWIASNATNAGTLVINAPTNTTTAELNLSSQINTGSLTLNLPALTGTTTLTLPTTANQKITVTGGMGADTIVISGQTLTSNASINGGAGTDTLKSITGANIATVGALTSVEQLDFAGTFTLTAAQLDGFTLLTGSSTPNLTLTTAVTAAMLDNAKIETTDTTITLANVANNAIILANATVPSSKTLKIDASALTGTNALTFDGSAEADGLLSVTGGAGADTITGGTGIDTLIGGDGADTIKTTIENFLNNNAVIDTIEGGLGVDSLLFTDTASPVTIRAGNTVNLNDLLSRIQNVEKITTVANSAPISITIDINNQVPDIGSDFTTIDLSGDTNSTGTNVISSTGANGITTIIGSAGVDKISVLTAAPATTVTGGLGIDTFTITAPASTVTITDLGNGNDVLTTVTSGTTNATLYLASGVVAYTAPFNINSGIGAFTTAVLTVGAATSGTVDLNNMANDGTLTINAPTATGALTLIGTPGMDSIVGGAGNDSIVGGEGSDTITGGQGTDTINLTETTSKIDTIIYSNLNESGDSIIGFVSGTDKIQLAKSVFTLGVAWNGNALVTTSNANNYAETATALTTNPLDLNGTGVAGGAGIIAVGAASGTGGVSVYHSHDIGAATTNNSTLLLTLTGISTVDIAATDFIGV